MTRGVYKLRIGDYAKMIRHIIAFVVINLLGMVVLIAFLGTGKVDLKTFPLEIYLVGFFVLVGAVFIVLQKKNMADEDVTLDSNAIHTSRFGTIYLNEIKNHYLARKKKREDLVIALNDGRKISFGPLVGRRSDHKQVYKEFKEALLGLIAR